jgi:hypothetical protein
MADGQIPMEVAFANAMQDRGSSYWPAGPQNRLEPVYSPILRPRFKLRPGAKIFTIGSCFARNIEEHLGRLGFDVPVLSLSVPPEEWRPAPSIVDKFTPPSALQEIERTLEMLQHPDRIERIIDDVLFPTSDGRVIDLELRQFMPVGRQRAHERRRHIFEVFANVFDADCVVITLGLVECWVDLLTGRAIQEAPHALALRRAKDRFALKILSYPEVLAAGERMVRLLIEHGRPDVKILLTVSPVPFRSTFSGTDVVMANCYSKSTLRTAAQVLYENFDQVDYFPSYEIVTMSRAPNVWKPDLIHVDPDFVAKVVDFFARDYVQLPPAVATPEYRTLCTLKAEFESHPPFGWGVYLPPEIRHLTVQSGSLERSPLRLFEDELQLGPSHEAYRSIFELGGGGYTFFGSKLYFSTSDGSDPNVNGRTLTVRVIDSPGGEAG